MLTIRRGDPDDVVHLASLRFEWRSRERGEKGLDQQSFEKELKEWTREHENSHVPFLAFETERPVGMAWLAVVDRIPGPEFLVRRSEMCIRDSDVGLDQIALGAGSDEFIVLLARIFAENGTVATVPADSYSMYRYAALMARASIIDDVEKADLVFVCRPNNPTGELPDIPQVSGQLVIDEAYAHYAGVDALEQVANGAIILRTFSKAYGLAGARVGYAVASPELTAVITSRQAPLSVSSLSAALALAALATPIDVSDQIAERERLAKELTLLGLEPVPSFTNFLFIPMEHPQDLVERLLPYGVVVRAFARGLRISVRDELDDNVLLLSLIHI